MNKGLEEYLKEKGAVPADEKIIEEYNRQMEKAMPRMEEAVRRQQRGAAIARYRPIGESRSQNRTDKPSGGMRYKPS